VTEIPQYRQDEILEAVFREREAGRHAAQGILTLVAEHAPGADLRELEALSVAGLIRIQAERVTLTEEGDRRANDLVRRHRLAERLFRDLLALGEGTVERQACAFEHILCPEAADSVCTLLGHPPTCPHGNPIPPGSCCGTFQRTVRPLVTGLPSFELGATGRIVFIAPKFHDRMDRLAALGVIPGSTIRLHQRSPSYVIEVGETTIALDPEIAGEIYVKPVETR
jgi:DtxR family Mn-dependent transcriptional regulator